MFKRLGRKQWLLIGGILVVVVVLTLLSARSSLAAWFVPEGPCAPAPAPLETIKGQYGVDAFNNVVYIARAIGATQEGLEIAGRTELVLPACWSRDPALTTITNLEITLMDGRKFRIYIGVIGRLRVPLAETPAAP